MKWYIEYPIIYLITVYSYFLVFTDNSQPMGLRIFISLVLGMFISAAGYAGYKNSSYQKKKKLRKINK